MKPKKKRQERRRRDLENDFNTNGYNMDHKGGTFRVFNKKSKEQVRGLSWEKAIALWRDCDNCLILQDK